MSIRREPTYLSTEVWRALRLVSKARSSGQDISRHISADELADQTLLATLKEQYPQLFEHQKKVAQMEKELLKTL